MTLLFRPWFILLCCVLTLSNGLSGQEDFKNKLDDNEILLQDDNKSETVAIAYEDDEENSDISDSDKDAQIEIIDDSGPRIINEIILKRPNPNNYIPDDAILNAITYKKGEIFKPHKTNKLIHNIYRLGEPFSYFEQIEVLGEDLPDGKINLHIIITEKIELASLIIEGNNHLPLKEIQKKIDVSNIHGLNEADIQALIKIIKLMYQEKNYHKPEISWEFKTSPGETKPSAILKIKEGNKSMVKRVFFVGNKNISHKQLKNIIFTREEWLGGFLTKAGSMQQDFLERDKHILENYYKSNGYMNARVTEVNVVIDDSNHFTVTFNIYEGEIYKINAIEITGDDSVNHDFLKNVLPVKPGENYSTENLRKSLEIIKDLWGDQGYLFVDAEPLIIPNEDKKTVNVTFNIEPGKKVLINRINIKGNKKTRDKVIRRNLVVKENDYVRHSQLEISKNRVENLSFFEERGGVNWKINRIDDENADIDLILNEIKTGKMLFNLGYGGSPIDIGSPTSSFSIGGSLIEANLFGRGIRLNISLNWSKQQTTFSINVADPWFLDKPIYSEFDFHVARSDYNEELQNVDDFKENRIGGYLGLGFVSGYKPWYNDVMVRLRTSFDNISYTRPPEVGKIETPVQAVKQLFLNNSFQPGGLSILELLIAKDFRNHTAHPTTGYQFSWNSRFGLGINTNNKDCSKEVCYYYNSEKHSIRIGATNEKFGYFKTELDMTYYTPLLPDNMLILMLHSFAGFVKKFENKAVPYADLFHIGGPASVRGFNYGQISPHFLGDSLGAGRAFFVNTELIFPIVNDFSVKGCIFYDGGAGWNSPYLDIISRFDETNKTKTINSLDNNKFNYRQSIGIGIRMIRPQPIRIDYGFKLDRKKGESISELHFSSYREF